jgi:hypothetical protein
MSWKKINYKHKQTKYSASDGLDCLPLYMGTSSAFKEPTFPPHVTSKENN